ncbi:GDP-mannose 4,6-dehydratase [bacterium]|nr:GDP-mannose 4,6-dehydratase [bacterium]
MNEKKRILIAGIAGFAGTHLAEFASEQGAQIYGLDRRQGNRWLNNLEPQPEVIVCDLLDYNAIADALARIQPHVIFHLAAQASVRQSIDEPAETFMANVVVTINLLEAVRKLKLDSKVLLITSSEVYGIVKPEELPLYEDAPLRPVHPYAVSKVTVHYLTYQYHHTHGLDVIEARAFNHIGPRQSLGFVLPDFSSQIAKLSEQPGRKVIKVGDLSARRDFTDVRDIVRGYWLLSEKGLPGGVYHLCSGGSISIDELLKEVISASGIPVEIEVDPARLRPSPMPDIWGSYEKIHSLCGWRPRIPWKKSVEDTYSFWSENSNEM